ncbi:MAG: hypothetical protein DSY66_04925 [Persephonella sp.]|nr:MAG: hypothetical protein DSY53_03490 [Persephonella sp.]RUM60118.1 MAG: hypothetical protein DSY66_04925 [Persephonella sp.]
MENKILVHICCGVDAVYPLRKLKEDFPNSKIVGYFYDPNIHPEEEYELRWLETKRVCDDLNIECIKGDYDLDIWLEKTKGLENEPERGERCSVCHDLRLEKTAKLAKELGFNKITTVLMMSPKKDFQVLKSIGEKTAKEYGLEFLAIDFRKGGGIEKMNKLSKEMEIYHQNYCGCLFALFQQRKGEYIPELTKFGKGRPAGSREELLFIKHIRLFSENLGLNCSEEEFQFIGWKVLNSSLKINKENVPHNVLYGSGSLKGVLRARVKDIIEKDNLTVFRLNKGNIEIWGLNTELKDIPLDNPRFLTNPIFIVGKEVKDNLYKNPKMEIQLKTEFDPNIKSRNLIIGNRQAEKYITFHSDTTLDGLNGVDLEIIKDVIKSNVEDIKSGSTAIIIFGAKNIGKIGEKVFYMENKYCLSSTEKTG